MKKEGIFVSGVQLWAHEGKFPSIAFFDKKQIFKFPFTPKNWLLKFGFACSLAQILEPKLLVHEILEFTWHLS